MASTRKSYILSPSWDLKPSEVALGSVIAEVLSPHRPLSHKNLPTEIDTEIHSIEAKNCSDKIKNGNRWSLGLFARFVQVVAGFNISSSSMSSSEIEFSCESMETRRLTLTPEFTTKAIDDPAVKCHLKIGGIGAKAFMITGVMIAKGVTITTTEEIRKDTTIQVGAEIPAAQITVGPKFTMNGTRYQTQTRRIMGPIVFAFQVEKLYINWRRLATNKAYVVGAMLGQSDEETEYVIEIADESLDDEDMSDLGLEARDGLDENGEKCRIILPCI